eukprot:3106724-Rhodomonas_salina.2
MSFAASKPGSGAPYASSVQDIAKQCVGKATVRVGAKLTPPLSRGAVRPEFQHAVLVTPVRKEAKKSEYSDRTRLTTPDKSLQTVCRSLTSSLVSNSSWIVWLAESGTLVAKVTVMVLVARGMLVSCPMDLNVNLPAYTT